MTEIDDLRRAIGIHAAAHVLLIAALLTPPSKLTHRQLAFVFLPLIWGCHFYTVTSILAQAVALHALWSTELLLFRNPREDFAIKHYGVSPKTLVKEKIDEFSTPNEKREVAWTEPYPEKPWRRISWVFSLLISFRYVGWATSPSSAQQWNSHTPTPKAQSRVFFIIRKFVLAVACMIITDFTNLYQYYDPYMRFESSIDSTFPRRLRDILAGYHISSISPRLVRISMLGLQQWCTYSLLGAAPAVVFVTLGGLGAVGDFWGRPENWPGVMGSPMVVAKRGLRGFWGGFWHQLFRNMLLSPSRAVTSFLNLPRSSTLCYALQVLLVFLLSGILQATTLPRHIPGINFLAYTKFMWIQGIFVLLEVAGSRVLNSMVGSRRIPLWLVVVLGAWRVLWTGSVLWHTVPIVQDQLMRVLRMVGLKTLTLFTAPKIGGYIETSIH